MLTPQKFESLVNNKVVDMYAQLNEELTNEVIKKIKSTGDISSYTKHQFKVLINNNGQEMFKKALMKTQRLTNKRKKEISKVFDELVNSQYKGYETVYDRKGMEYGISPESYQIVNDMMKSTNKELNNLTRTIAFSNKKQYVNAMDDLYKKVVSGGWSYDNAIKSTLINLTNDGLQLKKDGTNYNLEGAVRRNLFTSLKQTADRISKQMKDDLKLDYVWISITPYCRPSHRPINGVKMKVSTFENNYEYLTEEPNCYHIVNYVDKGFEIPLDEGYIRRANDNLEKNYKERQKQNYYARQVRQKKKEISTLGNSSDEILKEKKIQLRNAQIKYRTYSKSVGLGVDYFQTWQVGYNGPKK